MVLPNTVISTDAYPPGMHQALVSSVPKHQPSAPQVDARGKGCCVSLAGNNTPPTDKKNDLVSVRSETTICTTTHGTSIKHRSLHFWGPCLKTSSVLGMGGCKDTSARLSTQGLSHELVPLSGLFDH